MATNNIVFIAQSLDGYIADKEGKLDWLHAIPNPDQIDMGFVDILNRCDAIIMGRNTFETVCSFDVEWPYPIPVYVASSSLSSISDKYKDRATLVNGSPEEISKQLEETGHNNLYIDGGNTIQRFLQSGLISEMIITTIPVLLGGGAPLFGVLETPQNFKCVNSKIFLDSIVQNTFIKQ